MSLDLMAERTAELYAKCFGHAPRWIAAAPGRVNLIGEHTDYNQGLVLPMAIERYTVFAGDKNGSREVVLHSMTTGDTATFALRGLAPGNPAWSNYVRGVTANFKAVVPKLGGFQAAIDSTVPSSGGLSSSAALEVGAATLLEAITHHALDPLEKALLCQKAEHEFAGVPCGIMDQYTSVMAQKDHALLLDCRSNTSVPVPLPGNEVTVLVINTTVRRRVGDVEYAKRREQCETAAAALGIPSLRDANLKNLVGAQSRIDNVVFRRARHVITEIERTLQAAQAIKSSEWTVLGELMYASHESLRSDFEVSSPELDAVVEIAHGLAQDGVIGCRMTGAGFGGCAVCLVKSDAVAFLTRRFQEQFEFKTGSQPEIFATRPAAGARLIT
jgi:galactokinase